MSYTFSLGIIKKVWRVWSRQFAPFSDDMFYILFLKPYCPSHDWTFVSVNRLQLLPWWWCLRKKYSSNRVFEGFSNSGRFLTWRWVFGLALVFCIPLGFLCPARFFVSRWVFEDLRTWGPFFSRFMSCGSNYSKGHFVSLVFLGHVVFLWSNNKN